MQNLSNNRQYDRKMMLVESYGVITGKSKVVDLARIIADYIYDPVYGMDNDRFQSEENKYYITYDIIKSYYMFHYRLNDAQVIVLPQWLDNFYIAVAGNDVQADKSTLAAYYPMKTVYNEKNDSVKIYIYIDTDYQNQSKNKMMMALAHEFKHAYEHYMQLKKGNDNTFISDTELYNIGKDAFAKLRIYSKYTSFRDYIELNKEVFTDKDMLKDFILGTSYIMNPVEIHAYLESFYAEIIGLLRENKDNVLAEISKIRSLKGSLNDLNIISPYDSYYYCLYNAIRTFWNDVHGKADAELVDEVISENEEVIRKMAEQLKAKIDKSGNAPLVEFSDDGMKVMDKLSGKLVISAQDVIGKMQRIYFMCIDDMEKTDGMSIEDKVKVLANQNAWINKVDFDEDDD